METEFSQTSIKRTTLGNGHLCEFKFIYYDLLHTIQIHKGN